jgi:hypothetical protein
MSLVVVCMATASRPCTHCVHAGVLVCWCARSVPGRACTPLYIYIHTAVAAKSAFPRGRL